MGGRGSQLRAMDTGAREYLHTSVRFAGEPVAEPLRPPGGSHDRAHPAPARPAPPSAPCLPLRGRRRRWRLLAVACADRAVGAPVLSAARTPRLRVRQRGVGPGQILRVTLTEDDGTSWSAAVAVHTTWREQP